MPIMLDPQRLRYFQSVAEAGSFSRAARRLGVSQPTLSVQVARLEEEVGQTLLRRHRYGVELTPMGEKLLGRCQDLFARLVDIEHALQADVQEPAGDLSVAAVQSMGLFAIPETLAEFSARFPRVRVKVTTEHSDQVLDMLHASEVDLAFTARSEAPDAPFSEQLGDDPVLLVCGPQHRFWKRRFVRAQDLHGETLVRLGGNSPTGNLIDEILQKQGVDMHVLVETASVAVIVRTVAMSLGLAFLPYLAVKRELDAGTLHRIDFQQKELHRGLWASWTTAEPFPARDAFVRNVREVLRRTLAPQVRK